MSTQRLFPTPESINFGEAMDFLKETITPLVWKAIRDRTLDVGKRRESDPAFRILNSKQCAQFAHAQIIHEFRHLIREFPPENFIVPFQRQNMELFNHADKVIFTLKKLRHGFSRSNYLTRHNMSFWTNNGKGPIKLLAGYIPNKSWTNVTVHWTMPTATGVAAFKRIPDQTEAYAKIVEHFKLTNDETSPNQSKGFDVRPKKDSQRRKKGGDEDVS